MSFKLAARWLALLLAALLILASCGVQVGNLPNRVIGFLHSYDPANVDSFVGYFTPKIQEALKTYGHDMAGVLAMPGLPPAVQQAGKDSLSKVTAGDLSYQVRKAHGHQWAEVTVRFESLTGVAAEKLTWIKVGGQWYLFAGTAGEQNEYGEPPYFVH